MRFEAWMNLGLDGNGLFSKTLLIEGTCYVYTVNYTSCGTSIMPVSADGTVSIRPCRCCSLIHRPLGNHRSTLNCLTRSSHVVLVQPALYPVFYRSRHDMCHIESPGKRHANPYTSYIPRYRTEYQNMY